MSMHKTPLTPLEDAGLRAHGLDIGTSSQLSDALRQGVAWAIEQGRGEQVAIPARKSYEESFSVHGQGQIMGWNACLDEIAKPGPLYTHADPGEVERLLCIREIENRDLANDNHHLRAQLAEAQQKYRDELGKRLAGEVKFEAKLAERDALLARVVNSGALSSEQHEELEADCCAAVDVVHQIKRQAFREHLDKCAVLSVSEPVG